MTRIGITLGDPNGIGPEILLRTFAEGELREGTIVIGDIAVLRACSKKLDLDIVFQEVKDPEEASPGKLQVIDMSHKVPVELQVGRLTADGGRAALACIDQGVEMALKGKIDALVTLPVNKEAVRLESPGFQGHTDHIAMLCGINNYTMMLVSDRLIVTHISMHVPMKQALQMIHRDRIVQITRLTADVVGKLRESARIAVAGLNPHAGEHGAFGKEEIEEIEPAIQILKQQGLDVSGPHPPDTLFYQAVQGKYDAVVCMYHDQGHIPMKLLDFDRAVNMTLGLPIVRTSVDHGTAYDIAWEGRASLTSFVNACRLAEKMSEK